jgi:hypothetical protein
MGKKIPSTLLLTISGDGKVRACRRTRPAAPGQRKRGRHHHPDRHHRCSGAGPYHPLLRLRPGRPQTGARLLCAAWDDNAVTVHDLTDTTAPVITRIACLAPITGLRMDHADETLLVTTAGRSTVTAYDPHTGEEALRILGPGPIRAATLSADATLAAYITDEPTAPRRPRHRQADLKHRGPDRVRE